MGAPFREVAKRREGSEWDEDENATGRRFHPRSHENKEPQERAMLRRRATIFSEAKPERLSEPERDRAAARRR